MASSSNYSPGWYTSPDDPQQQRLYDGVAWTDSTRPTPGRFAAKHAHRTAAVWLLVIGGLFFLGVLGGFGGVVQAIGSGIGVGGALGALIFPIVVSGGLITWGIYLLRGRGENPAKAAERAQQRLAAEQGFHAAVENLSRNRTGAAAVVALRHLDYAGVEAFGDEGPARIEEAHQALGIDADSFSSPRLGALAVVGSEDWFEVYADWIIFGYAAHDVDEHTHMNVYLDGGIQVVARQVQQGNRMVTQNDHVDMRQANVQVVSDQWSLGAPIHPDQVNDARRIADQLERIVAKKRPQAASSADIRAMVDAIVSANGQPVAEKLKQLSNLRYDRVLSDEDFEIAKNKIIANPGVSY